MKFVARGVIGPHGANYALVGKSTYLCEGPQGWYQWDGLHKATHFATAEGALAAAAECGGPLFQLPSPETIEAVPVDELPPDSSWPPLGNS